MPDFNVLTFEHLVLLYELYGHAEVPCDRGTNLIYTSIHICHQGEDVFIGIILLFVFEGMHMLGLIYYSTEYMTVLFIVVKLNIDFERQDVPISILHK